MSLDSFIIRPYRRKYLREYGRRMSSDDETQLWDDNVASVLEEQGFTIKDSPRSVYKVEKLYASLAKYAPDQSPTVNLRDKHVESGIRMAYAAFAKPKDEPYLQHLMFNPEMILSITSNMKGSAGLTAWGQTKAQSLVRAYERGRQTLTGEKSPEPCIAFKRTQFNDKTRLVWGFPYSMTAIEGLFARPLIKRFLKVFNPMAFGKSTGYLGTKLRVASYNNRYAYSTDVSSFDASMSATLIKVAFEIISTWFDMNGDVETASGDTLRVSEVWNKIVTYFITTPIVMPDLNLYLGKRHGVPSGSYFTQIIDSVINTIIVGTISSKFAMHIDKEHLSVLGDDVLFWSNRKISLETLAKYASETFNANFNAEKSAMFESGEIVHYLGRDWENGVPDLPMDDILIRMTQPEKFRKYSADPVERKRQVKLLLASYAAVYKTAFRIFFRTIYHRRRAPNAIYEWRTYGDKGRSDWASEHMSGLQRYLLKYGRQDVKKTPSFAFTFWK